jgi:anti-anti-sigma factor
LPANEELLVDGPLGVAWDRFGDHVVVVALSGELDRSNVASARGVIGEVTTGDPDELIVIDLSALEFIDSSGIELLITLAAADGDGDGLRIVPSEAPAVARVLRVTGVDSMIQIARARPAAGSRS